MQVFVRRSDLTLATGEAVPVMGYYEDSAAITPQMQRPGFTLLSLATTAMQPGPLMSELVTGWRESNKPQIVYGEAGRRILDVFPEHSQRNSVHEINSYLTQHGADSSRWPATARARQAEIDRCWTYLNAVRATANAMLKSALPADPTRDSHWPTRVGPYQPQ